MSRFRVGDERVGIVSTSKEVLRDSTSHVDIARTVRETFLRSFGCSPIAAPM